MFDKRHAVAWLGALVHVVLVSFMFFHFATPKHPFDMPGLCFFSLLVVVPWIVFAKHAPLPDVNPMASRAWDIAGLTFLALSSWVYWTDVIFPTGRRDAQEALAFITVPMYAAIVMVPIKLVIGWAWPARK
jgi:hypothetical protein